MSRMQRIEALLIENISPEQLLVENESHRHQVPKRSETHVKLTVISHRFQNVTRINRQRMIHALLEEELKTGLHALSMHLFTPEEWQQKGGTTLPSPACKHSR